jgi:hypothetical protein
MKIFWILAAVIYLLFMIAFIEHSEILMIYFGIMYLSVLICAVGHQTDPNKR